MGPRHQGLGRGLSPPQCPGLRVRGPPGTDSGCVGCPTSSPCPSGHPQPETCTQPRVFSMCFNEGWCLPPAPWAEGGEGREISARNREGGEGDTWKGREQWCGDRRGRGPPQTRVAAPWEGSELLGDVLVDPVQVLGDTGVDAGPVGLGAAVPPADHTCLQPGAVDLADQGPSRVTLGRRGVSSGWRGWGGWGLWGGQGPPGRSPFSCSRHTSCRHGRSGRCPPCTGQCGTPSHTGCFPRWGPSPAAAGMAVAGVLRVSGEAITVLGQLLGPLPQREPQS